MTSDPLDFFVELVKISNQMLVVWTNVLKFTSATKVFIAIK